MEGSKVTVATYTVPTEATPAQDKPQQLQSPDSKPRHRRSSRVVLENNTYRYVKTFGAKGPTAHLYDVVTLPCDSIYGLACIGPTMCEDMYPHRELNIHNSNNNNSNNNSNNNNNNIEDANDSLCSRFVGYLSMVTSTYFLLTINFIAQGVLIFNLGEVVIISRNAEKVCMSSPWLRICCIFLFGSFIFEDLLQSVSMLRWHLAVKTEPHHKPLIVRIHRTENHHHVLGSEIASGLTFWHKLLNVCGIIFPKFVYGVALVFAGGGFIALSTNNEGILVNTMALYFIIQVDEFLLKAFVTEDMKHSMNNVPGVLVSYTKGQHSCGGIAFAKTMTAAGGVIKVCIVVVVSKVLEQWSCTPGWDRVARNGTQVSDELRMWGTF